MKINAKKISIIKHNSITPKLWHFQDKDSERNTFLKSLLPLKSFSINFKDSEKRSKSFSSLLRYLAISESVGLYCELFCSTLFYFPKERVYNKYFKLTRTSELSLSILFTIHQILITFISPFSQHKNIQLGWCFILSFALFWSRTNKTFIFHN